MDFIREITFREVRHFDFSKISLFNSATILGLLVNRFAWAMPYLYVLFTGKNLPIWFGGSIFIWIILGSFISIYRIRKERLVDTSL